MSSNGIVRAHYFERQFLRTQDFIDEQRYHIDMRRRHNIAHHTWGIVHGLEVVADEDQANLYVQPGMAIDGYGRELILAETQPLSTALFDSRQSDTLDVWLTYYRLSSDQAPEGYAGCTTNGATPYYRWQERPLIRLDLPNQSFLNRRRPQSVPEGDLDFAANRTPPDDPLDDWPVFLGQIKRTRSAPDKPYTYSVDLTNRPYVGLVGEAVWAPSGGASIQLGSEQASDRRRFAIFLPAHSKPYANGPLSHRLAIYENGEIDLANKVTLHGDLTLRTGVIEFGVGTASSQPTPWRIYHLLQQPSTNGGQTDNGQQGGLEHQLRIELASDGDQATGRNQVAIGAWSADQKTFKSILTVDDRGYVIIDGKLVVDKIESATARAAPVLSPEAQNFGQAALLTGIGGASTLLSSLYRNPNESDLQVVARLLDDPQGRQDVAGVLLASQQRRESFLLIIVANEVGRQALFNSLRSDANLLAEFVTLIVADSTGRQAIVNRLAASPQQREAFAEQLMAFGDIRNTLSRSLLAINEGREAIVNSLTIQTQLDAFVSQLIGNTNVRRTIIGDLLASTEGMRAIVDALQLAHQIEDFAAQLLVNTAVRDALIAQLLANTTSQQAIITVLAANPAQLRNFTTQLLGNTTARDVVTASLLAIQDGQQAIVTVLAANPAQLESFINRLRSNATTRDAVTASLLAIQDGRQAIITVLAANPAQLEDFANRLRDNPTTRSAITASLLAIQDGRQAIVTLLAANAEQLEDFISRLRNNATARETMITTLLRIQDGRQAIVNSLAGNPTQLDDFTERLVANSTARTATITNLLALAEGQAGVADGLLATTEGQRALATNLAGESARVVSFANLLLAEFHELAEQLRTALTPPP